MRQFIDTVETMHLMESIDVVLFEDFDAASFTRKIAAVKQLADRGATPDEKNAASLALQRLTDRATREASKMQSSDKMAFIRDLDQMGIRIHVANGGGSSGGKAHGNFGSGGAYPLPGPGQQFSFWSPKHSVSARVRISRASRGPEYQVTMEVREHHARDGGFEVHDDVVYSPFNTEFTIERDFAGTFFEQKSFGNEAMVQNLLRRYEMKREPTYRGASNG